LPHGERKWFRNRSALRIAFTLDALEHEPEAEIAVLGSAFVYQLVAPIRPRGSRAFHGQLPPEQAPGADVAELRVPITNGGADAARVDVAWHRVVRILARVVIRAGGNLEEHLLESRFIDATTGIAIREDIAAKCARHAEKRGSLSCHPEERSDEGSALASHGFNSSHAPLAPTRPID